MELVLYMALAAVLVLVLVLHPGSRISRRQYQETLRELPIGVVSLRGTGQVQLWNRSMEEITGLSGESAVGTKVSSLPAPWGQVLTDFVHSPANVEPRVHLPGLDGTSRWIGLHKSSVQSFWRRSRDPVIVVEDLTDYEVLEQELMHSERLASIGRLAAGVAHEIGNPVTGIACLAQNLEFEENRKAIADTAADILQQTDRVTRIVESLVNFSHNGRDVTSTGELKALNLADCIDESVHLLQLDHRAREVHFDNDTDRELLVLGDSQRLLQVFINLLSNARDASPAGGHIRVRSRLLDGQVRVCVIDEGEGVPAAIQSQIFEPFFTTKEPGEGTGLGLALVYSILENLGGRITVTSPVEGGRGTEFEVQLQRASYESEYLENQA